MSRLPVLTPTEAGQLRSEWLKAVEALMSQVRDWAERRGWMVTEEPRQIVEERLVLQRRISIPDHGGP